LIVITDTGILYQICLQTNLKENFNLGQIDLCAFAHNISFPDLIATGGDEQELCVWNLKNLKTFQWKAKNVSFLSFMNFL
jgi:hypothetical protein